MQKKMLLVLCVVELMETLLESSTSPMGSALCRTAPSKGQPPLLRLRRAYTSYLSLREVMNSEQNSCFFFFDKQEQAENLKIKQYVFSNRKKNLYIFTK